MIQDQDGTAAIPPGRIESRVRDISRHATGARGQHSDGRFWFVGVFAVFHAERVVFVPPAGAGKRTQPDDRPPARRRPSEQDSLPAW